MHRNSPLTLRNFARNSFGILGYLSDYFGIHRHSPLTLGLLPETVWSFSDIYGMLRYASAFSIDARHFARNSFGIVGYLSDFDFGIHRHSPMTLGILLGRVSAFSGIYRIASVTIGILC
jgi:hypothetical protein